MTKNLIGRICIKTCGRESNRKCVIVDELDEHFVLVDGNVKRRRCNIANLEMLNLAQLKIKPAAPTEEARKAMKDAWIEITEPRKKEGSSGKKPVSQKRAKDVSEAQESVKKTSAAKPAEKAVQKKEQKTGKSQSGSKK